MNHLDKRMIVSKAVSLSWSSSYHPDHVQGGFQMSQS